PRMKSNRMPIGSSGSSRSEKRMAASTSIRRIGWSVTSVARSGVRQRSSREYRSRRARYSLMYRPAWRMNHTGVASTGSRRQALMNRVAASVSVHLEGGPGEAHEVLEPHRLEAQLGAQLAELVRDRVVEKKIAGHDRDRGVALIVVRPQP